MAESKDTKQAKKPGSFADDLDSMLNLDEGTEQQVGLIDDDDAIDRLLMGDAFAEQEYEEGDQKGIDKLIGENAEKNQDSQVDFDEFGDDADDFMPDFQIGSEAVQDIAIDEVEPFDVVDDEETVDLTALESVGEIDEFADDAPALPDFKVEPIQSKPDELAAMTEIDEFSDGAVSFGSDKADFLLADFDISSDDEIEPSFEQAQPADAEALLVPDSASPASSYDEIGPDELANEATNIEVTKPEPILAVADERPAQGIDTQSLSEQGALIAKLTAELAGLNNHLNELKKQHQHLKQQVQLKGNQEELHDCQESIDILKTEQKKQKRSLDTLSSKKPVSAYVANAIGVLALIVAGGIGFQGYVTKVQLGQLVEFVGKLQTQINTAPVADAADKEMLRKQMDELTLANSVITNQLAELSKSLQGNGAQATGGQGKQLEALGQQDMQMGAAIEALQAKVSALEKGKAPVAAAKPPVVKKKPVVQENWVVNLVAFKQDWYARRKAEEFAAKGVGATVIKADSKGEIWYRLVVDGFKSQYEAAAYAARVKKTLNLDSVWVAKNKD